MRQDFEYEEDFHYYLDSLTLEQILKHKESTDVDVLVAIGRKFGRQRRFTDAESYFERAVEKDPANPWTMLFFGNLYFVWEKNDDAARCFEAAIDLAPDLAPPYWCLGDVYAAILKDALAGEMYQKAVHIAPEDEQAERKLRNWNERNAGR